MNFGTVDYVWDGNRQPTFCNNQITGMFPHMGEIQHFRVMPITFLTHGSDFFEQAYRTHRRTDFNEQYLIMCVSGGTPYIWGLNQW